MTKRELYTEIMNAMCDNAEIVDFCNHEIELLDGRKSRVATKKTLGNAGFVATVINGLESCGEPVTITELQNRVPELSATAGISNQKISATMRKLVEDGIVVKTTDKRKSYFEVVSVDTDTAESVDNA